ncbi:hypothetical protein BDR04DRAFT_1234127 [Suillus decipiens]|nr:hypothetical protein BDR04DRAFT_1234127 [Suillus decipiens]
MSTTDRPKQSGGSRKMFQQRHYRSTEAEDFAQLRQIIRDVTQESPNTRHDILKKAAEIIKQLADYNSLLEEYAASILTTTSSSTDPPMQYPTPVHPVSYFPPENLSINYDHPMSIYPSYTYDYVYLDSQSG